MSGATEDAPGVCPVCRSDDFRVPTFTMWGGMIGHRLLNHVYCNACGSGFNSKTGTSNLTRIILYQVGMIALFVPLFGFFFLILLNL